MRKSIILVSTAVGLALTASALAQSPTSSPTNKDTTGAQDKTAAPSNNSAQSATPSTSGSSTAQGQSPSGSSASPSAQTTTPSGSSAPSTAQSTPAPTGSSSSQTTPNNNASNTSNNTGNNGQAAPNSAARTPSQAQSSPSNTAGQSSPSPSAQSGANSGGPTTNQAQSPANNTTNAQSSQSNATPGINVNDQQRTRITQSISRLNVQPLNNVNFQVSVGTVVPRDVRLETLPSDIVEVVPQYRGYNFFVVRDEIVIVEPSTLKIVTVLPRSGGSTASAPSNSSRVTFSERDRAAIKQHASRPRTETRAATTTTTTTRLRRGERVPETVELEEFPEEVYRDSPDLRTYRYVHRENRTYVVEPRERTIIEEID